VVIVRTATTADAAVLAKLARQTFVDTFEADNSAEDMDAYCSGAFGEVQQRHELETEGIVTLLAETYGEAVAYAQLHVTPGAPHGDVELARFYVDRAHHGRGVAQMLMEVVNAHAVALGGTRLWLGVWERNFRAIAFYRKNGFIQRGAQPFQLGSDLQTDWVMNREL
jgi:ribosomal protein S18 acetylase RimI-like enzyme